MPRSDAAGGWRNWTSKDTWVLTVRIRAIDPQADGGLLRHLSSHAVTSRVAESFYWMGRHLSARIIAYLISVVET